MPLTKQLGTPRILEVQMTRRQRTELRLEIEKHEKLVRLLKVIDDSIDTISTPPFTGALLMPSRGIVGEEVDFDELWYHYPLHSLTDSDGDAARFMLRLPTARAGWAITELSLRGVAVPTPWTVPVDLARLTSSQIGLLTSAVNTLANTRTAN